MGARVYVDVAIKFQRPDPEPWMAESACTRYDPELFFPTPSDRERNTERAKGICLNECEVRLKCLAYTLDHEKGTSRRYGIAGATTPTQREELQTALDRVERRTS